MTAGPIARALRFLKSTSLNCGAPEVGAGVTEADSGGVVAAGKAADGDPAGAEDEPGGDSSCASAIEQTNKVTMKASRVLISVKDKSWRFAFRRQAHRCFCAAENAVIVDLV